MAEDNATSDNTDSQLLDELQLKTRDLELGAKSFSSAMTRAFSMSIVGGRQFDDVLKSLGLRLSDIALKIAFRPLERALSSGLESIFSGLFNFSGSGISLAAATGAVKPFASGGVIGTPTYFPIAGGVGLAGEAGPEAIMPLKRGPDGRLGVAAQGGGAPSITINIATPDAESFRRSESFVTSQIARAVARGQRSL